MAEAREHGLLMRGDMVRATLGVELPGGVPKRRTWRRMDRRTYRWWAASDLFEDDKEWPRVEDCNGDWHYAPCHLGAVGDRLWVRETFAQVMPLASGRLEYDGARLVLGPDGPRELWYRADGELGILARLFDDGPRWTPSIHMPRWASRLTLGILGVRFLRPIDLSDAECREEGFSGREAFLAALTTMHGKGVLEERGWALHFDVLDVRS